MSAIRRLPPSGARNRGDIFGVETTAQRLKRLVGRIEKAGLGGDAWRAADDLSASCDRIHPSLRIRQ